MLVPRWFKDLDQRVVPWLEAKGRVLIGMMSINPLLKTIDQSELSASEKEQWKQYLLSKWELASSTQDRDLSREFLINGSREVVASYSGLYYAFLAVGARDFKQTSLTDRQVEEGQRLISITTSNMLDGVYALDELDPAKVDLYGLLTGWRVDGTDGRGNRERDKNVRNFLRALHRLNEQEMHRGDNKSRDMLADFRMELQAFRNAVEQQTQTAAEES